MIEVPETLETEKNGVSSQGAGKEHMRLVDDALVPGHLDPWPWSHLSFTLHTNTVDECWRFIAVARGKNPLFKSQHITT